MCVRGTVVIGILLSALAGTSVSGQDRLSDPHVRTASSVLAQIIGDGADRSPTFRRVVAALSDSDVVAYVDFDGRLPVGLGGRTVLVSAAGGLRYVHIAICHHLAPSQRIAMVAHELQHALEIAGAPDVIDARSLARFYRRIGTHASACHGECYETAAAIDVERRVDRELSVRTKAPNDAPADVFEPVAESW
jgi:hypothetical protein